MSFYVEAVLGVNFAVDLVLLLLVGLALGLPIRLSRLSAGALAGALFALLHLSGTVPAASSVPAKTAAAALMVFLAFRPPHLTSMAQALGLLYLESMAAGGLVLALAAGRGAAVPAGGVIVLGREARRFLPHAVAGAACLSYLCGGLIRRAAAARRNCYQSTIVVGPRRATLQALLDTGNELVDPLTRWPVLVVEYAAISAVLPPGLRAGFASGRAESLEMGSGTGCGEDGWDARIRLLPFRSLGSGGGLLLGFRPDAVIVESRHTGRRRLEGLLVAVSPRRLGRAGWYQGLLPASALT